MKALVVLFVVLVLTTSASFLIGLYRYSHPEGQLIPLDQLPNLPSLSTAQPTATPIPTPEPIPDQHVIPQQLHVFQTFNNCGPASLSMQLSYFDKDVSQKTLGDILRPYQHPTGDNDDKSVTLSELADQASNYGLHSVHRPNGSIEKLAQLIALDLPVVIRTWLKEGEDIGHYRVIRGYDLNTGTLVQDDSLQGKNLTYTFEEMESLWQPFNYEYL
ncbi:MAG: hypothetical protein QG639_238, partial [Patescibacteria group bacterium]|nr:hypothetical protein [Patescibacteria group bacterium]